MATMAAPLRVPRSRALVEVIGPAGCGKSTLIATLAERATGVRIDRGLWGQPRVRIARAALSLASLARRALAEGSSFRTDEFAQMSRVECLQRRLDARLTDEAIIMDEGPVFALAWMRVFHDDVAGHARLEWRHHAAREWARRLTMVVRLDAADGTLARRIRERTKPHMVRDEPIEDIHRFTARFRSAFDLVLDEIRATDPISILHLDTDAASPARAADHVVTALAAMGSAR
jgi:deoxyadenosine/deoxycytidine kinase